MRMTSIAAAKFTARMVQLQHPKAIRQPAQMVLWLAAKPGHSKHRVILIYLGYEQFFLQKWGSSQ